MKSQLSLSFCSSKPAFLVSLWTYRVTTLEKLYSSTLPATHLYLLWSKPSLFLCFIRVRLSLISLPVWLWSFEVILIFLSKELLEHYSWVQHKDSFSCVRDSPPIFLPIMVFVYPVAIWPSWLSSACDLLWFTDCFCQIPSPLFSSLNLVQWIIID